MKIQSLHLKHFRRFDDLEINFHEKLTVLVARNGAGKTSILDGLAVALGPFLTRLPGVSGLSPKDSDFQILSDGSKPPFMRLTCETLNGIRWDRTERRDKTKTTTKQIPDAVGIKALNDYADIFIEQFNNRTSFELPVFVYYGTGRGVFNVPARTRGFGKTFSRFDALKGGLESRTNFRSFVEYFYALEEIETQQQKAARSFDLETPELKTIRRAVAKMMPAFSNPRGVYPAGIAIDWQQEGISKVLRIEQLSDGYRTTLAMVMDMAARMAEANPDMEDPLLTEGVVMIDEVDLHLHPGWQQTILLDLMRTFKNMQFIVSTHSPQIISSVKPECLRVIDWQGEVAVLLPVAFSEGAEAQQVLIDVLGLDSPRVVALDIVQTLERYQELVACDQWDSKEAFELRKTLDHWGAEHEPELARLDMDIRMKEWEREQP